MRLWLAALLILTTMSCREADGPIGPGAGGVQLLIDSSPGGARIIIDDRDSGTRTPDTVRVSAGEHTLRLRLDTLGFVYDYTAFLRVERTDSGARIFAPLTMQCPLESPSACYTAARRQRDAAGLRFTTAAFGALFFWNGSGQGVFWPGSTSNSYASSGMPVLAGRANGEPVALGIYDQVFLAGRPAPEVRTTGGRFELTQRAWIVPPFHPLIRAATVRGIEITEHVIASDAVEGVLLLKLVFRNISHLEEFRIAGMHLPPGDVTYTDTYIGFALDPDIGDAPDDWLSYDAELDMAFAYDAHFTESLFVGNASAAPGLVGLRVLRRPAGTNVVLNGWTNRGNTSSDWYAGTASELNGFNMLTGQASYPPDHAHPEIGHLPPFEGDARITVTAGPVTLAPGDSAEIVIALAFAAPVAGTFTPGVLMEPGDPVVQTRPLYQTAAHLRERMRLAESIVF
ncbi:MAG TPA: PEGA domain-containing protein [Longimicrobiales bacterium]|nr:PEGA domain-containing protein [Longimicrobiales bacterium]